MPAAKGALPSKAMCEAFFKGSKTCPKCGWSSKAYAIATFKRHMMEAHGITDTARDSGPKAVAAKAAVEAAGQSTPKLMAISFEGLKAWARENGIAVPPHAYGKGTLVSDIIAKKKRKGSKATAQKTKAKPTRAVKKTKT